MQSFLGGARSRASSRRRKNLPWPHRRITGEWLEQRTVLSANLNFAIAGVLPNGELAQQGYAVRTDAAGNIYELTDQNVIKYDAAGRQLWSLPYDANIGLGDSAKEGLAVDNAGDVYITGGFDNLAGSPATFGSTSLVSAGADDGFLAKISSAGSFLWAQSFGGSGDDKAYAVATDSSGNAYVTGYINGTAAIGSGTNAQILNIGKGQDILVAKFDADGTLAWANAYGNNDITNEGRGIAVDGQGNVYVTGSFDGTVNFGATQFYSFFGSAFFMKLDTNGQIQWVEKLNTEPDNNDGMAHGYAIAVDSAGNVYATGQFGGDVDLNPKGGDLVTVSNFVFEDTYVLKLSTAGNFVWAADLHHVAGLGGLRANDIAVSPQGNVYTTGWYDGTANFSPNGLYLKTSSGFDDVFVSALKNNGTFLWAATAGEASFSDDGYGIAATTGPGGDYVYAVGTFSNGLDQNANQVGVNFNSGLGPADTVLANGTWDSFLWGLDSLPTRINGLVWNDQNGDGIRQSSEPGVPNITVQLFYGTPGSGTPVASTVTDSLGLYSFNGVAPGNNYYVQVAPAGGVFTGENAGSDPTIASNVSPTSGDSGAITVAAGQTVLVNAGLQTVVSSPGLNLAFGIPTSGFTYGSGVVADAVGDFYVTGSFSGTRTLGSGANVVSLSASAPSDFIAKYAANGTLLWAKQIVSAIGEYFSKIMLDSFGNVYVAGEISGNATLGGLSLTAGANGNSVFLAKLDSNGNPLWATTVLDNAVEPNVGLAVDSSGNAYVAGGFSSSATVATSPVTTLTSAGGNDVFVVKYSPQGAAQWAENYGGKGDDAADSAAIGPDGNPVITGTFNSSASFGATTLTSGSSFANDFVAKINAADGSVVWADALSSTLDSGPPTYGNVDPTSRIAVDSAGNVYSTGSYDGTIQLNPTAATDAVQGTNAMFISKLDTNGKFVWGKGFSISPNGYDVEGFGIAVDPNGNVFSTGTFARTINFDPAGSSAGNLTANGASYDIYLSELDSNGKFVNVQQFGGSGEDGGSMVSVDANSNVYLTGLSYGPATFGKIIVGAKGDQDIFVARIGPNITPRTNIAPSFNILGPLQAVSLNAPPQTAPNFLSNIVPGLPGEQNEVVNFNVTNDNPALFTVPPAIDSNGTLTYTPAPGVSGSTTVTVLAHNNGGTANGGSDTSAAKTFPITVNVNHAPSFTGGANRTVNENSGPELYSGWATNLSAGPPGEANQTLTFHTAVSITAGGPDVTSGASSLFSAGPSIDSAGNLSFTPAADEWGTALVTVTLQDNGGTAFGGVDTSTSQTFFITVNLVNHVPSFTAGANQTVDENAGPQSVAGWATQVSAGPPSEANQNLTFIVTGDSNPSLFAAAPQISPSGTLTYTPATDVSGTATISVDLQDSGGTANGGKNTSAVQTFTIAVNFVNQPPTFVSAGNVTVLENSGPANQSKWATNISPGAPQEANQLLMFQLNTVSTPPGLFSVAPAIDSSGNLTFTPAANEFGTAQVAVTLVDDGREPDGSLGTPASSAPLTFTITVALVNHAPSFTAGGSQTVIENAGMQTAPGWATGMSAGPPSEAGQTLNFVLTPTNPALFSVPPAIDPATGNLTYTPAPDVSGQTLVSVQLHDSGGTANGGQDTSAPQTFGITINFVNQTPQFTAGADQTVHETPGPQTVPGWATGISPGAPQEQNQSLTFVVSTDNNALFSTPPAIDPITGNLTYTPAVYATGTAHVSVQLKDDGREPDGSFGPTAISPSQSFTITVTESNQAPVFTPGPDQVLSGSFSAITVPGWAANISPGPPNESGQALNFIVTNDNNTMFAVPPAIDTSGNLTFTPLPQTSGQADVTVRLHDNGGTANGGVDTSAPVTFLISITYVNQAPTFTAGANQAVLENAVISPVAGWATNINAGAADEASQQLNFLVSTDKPQLFSTPPAIDSSGNLTYTLAPNANGVANVNVQLHDNGGTANGGHDTSAPQTFTITIVPVNQPPLFTAGTNQTVLENPGTVTVKGWASGISPGAANEASQTLNFLVSTDNPTLFPTPPTIDPATGNLSFTPAFDEVGTATVSVQLHDNGGTANGGQDTSAAQSFTITVLPVNQPPVVTLGANQVVNENSGARTVSGWATNIGPGGPNEIGQQLNFLVSSDNPGLFTVPPQIDVATGNLTYTVAPFTSGTAHVSVQLHDNGGTANGGRDTSTPQVFTITVNFVNEAPSFTLPGTSPTVNENSGNATFWNFATQISPSSGYPPAPNEGSQTVHFNASNNNPGLFSAQPTIDPAGNLRFTSAPNASGTATVTAALQDNGGTANGGQDTSAAQQFTITVNFVNQAPTITSLGANVVANEDSGQVSMANFVSTASPPGPNAAPQQITYLVTPLNPNLFTTAGQPAIGADGMLTFTPGLHAVGSTSVTVQAQNSAGTAYGGNDLSTPSKFFIQIQQIDHAPTVANPLADVTVNESARAFDQVIGNLANVFDDIDIDLGLGDFLTLSISGDSNPSLVTASLSDADPATSQLDLHFLAGQYGAAVINLRATDQAGKYVDDPLNITVNQTVVAFDHSYVLSLGAASAVNATQGVLTGDSAPGGLPLSATLVSQAAFGTVTLHADGSFTYAKGPNFAGIDSFTYQATDGSGTSNVATVNITSFEATMVTKLYQQVLHRAPDTAGLQFWVNQVQQGKPYGAVAQGIFQSPERLDPIIESYYHQFLNRPADSAGLTYWYGVWVAHGGPEPVVAGMISSPEFYSLAQQAYAGLSPSTAWVTALYHRLLNRAPDPAGLTYWTGLIDSGTLGLSQVVNDFNISPEYYQNLTVGFFNQYLGRAPTTDELQHYVGLFEQGASQSDLQIQIINSPAYSNSPPPPVAGTMRMLS